MSIGKSEASTPELVPPSALRRRRRRNLLATCLLAVVAAGSWYWLRDGDSGPAEEPLIVTVEVGSIENTIASAGALKPSSFVDVGAQVSGLLEKLHVDVGDLVETGQLLAEIDARVQQNRVESSRANLESLHAQLEARRAALGLAGANAERQQRLMEANATSQLAYDTAMNNLVSAESALVQMEKQIEQSVASLATEETQLDFTRIYAPISGTVVSIEMNEGRTLNANQQAPTILRIADLTTMTVETQISEADIGRVQRGMGVYFTTLGSGNRRWEGELRQIRPTPQVENNVVLYTGLFDVDNPDGVLLPEMTAQVYFVTSAARNVLTVPVGALTFQDAPGVEMAGRAQRLAGQFPGDGGAFPSGEARAALGAPLQGASERRLATVEVIRNDGTRQQREIIVGVTSRIGAEVISGLEVGESVVAGIIQNVPGMDAGGDFRGGGLRMGGGFR